MLKTGRLARNCYGLFLRGRRPLSGAITTSGDRLRRHGWYVRQYRFSLLQLVDKVLQVLARLPSCDASIPICTQSKHLPTS